MPDENPSPPLYATCVAWHGQGILLRGSSGAGKSDLALRLIDRGAVLIADDLVRLSFEEGRLWALSEPSGAGLLEVRGLGILRFPFKARAPLGLCVDLVPKAEVPRLPEPASFVWGQVSVPMIALAAFDVSTPLKITAWFDYSMIEGARSGES